MDGPFGPWTAVDYIRFKTYEILVHTWDLARASGQSTDLDPALCTAGIAMFAAMNLPRSADTIGPEQPAPPDANPADRLAAYLGRTL